MNQSSPTCSTKQERDALFASMFAGIAPAEKKTPTLVEQLMPFRPQLIALRKAGYSVRQIADRLKDPPLSIAASRTSLNNVIGGPAAERRAMIRKLAAQRAANLAANNPATNASPPPAQPANSARKG